MDNDNPQDERIPRRRRYKIYGEPGNESIKAPRATVWRLTTLDEAVPAKQAKSCDGASTSGARNRQSFTEEAPEVRDMAADMELVTGPQPQTNVAHNISFEESEGIFSARERQSEIDQDSISTDVICDEEDMSHNSSSDSSEGQQSQIDESCHQRKPNPSLASSLNRARSAADPERRSNNVIPIPSLSIPSENADSNEFESEAENSNILNPNSDTAAEVSNQDNEDSSSSDSDDGHPFDDEAHDLNGFSDSDDETEEQPSAPPSPQQPPSPDEPSPPPSPEHPPPEDPQQPEQPPPAPSHRRLRTELSGKYSGRIEDRVAASTGEVLLNIQEFCKKHPLPLTAQEDLHKLINSMFYKEVIPESTYKLDKLYGTGGEHARYFFFCSKCYESFGELNHKTVKEIKCPLCGTNNSINDLTKAHYFIIIDFVKQLELLLENKEIASQLKNPNYFPDNGNVLNDLYDGVMYKKFVASTEFRRGRFHITLTACTDGTPVFKTVTFSIWPIFVIINELPKHTRMANVLLAGLWFGKKHPKMDLFLEPFSDYIRKLSTVGFTINVLGEIRLYFAYLIAMCVDSGARGSVQCVHSHNGAYPCNWCLHPGETEGDGSNARKFPQLATRPEERTLEQMIRDGQSVLYLPGTNNHINGVTGLSPLLRCPKFHIIHGMVLDNLHWASFGVARRMGTLWLGETKKKKKNNNEQQIPMPPFYVGTDETKSVVSARISKLRPPLEVRRLPRQVSQVHDYNAREWENMTLYFSIPVFKNILPERYLKHWMLFVQAFYLLMKSDLTKHEAEVAGILMEKYVNGVEELYGRKELTFNMHLCTHAMDNALRWSNGSSISTFAFENGNKHLKAKIHAERGISHQLLRSLDRDSALNILRNLASTPQSSDFRSRMDRKEVKKSFFAGAVRCMKPKSFSPSREELWHCDQLNVDAAQFLECSRIIYGNVCYSVDNGKSRTDNSYACCKDHTIVKIRKIIASEILGDVLLFVSKVRCSPCSLPRSVITTGNFSPSLFTINLVEQGIIAISTAQLKTICVNMNINCRFLKEHFICVMANTSNVF